MTYEEFLDKLKQEEINYYDELVKKYYALDSRRSEFQPKDETEYDKWDSYRNQLEQISSDYDVHDYSETIMKYGEDKYKTRLNNRISEHIDKLNKQIKKEIGKGVSVVDNGNNSYHIEGNNGTCNIVVSPIKASSNGNVVKTRIKISDVVKREAPLDYVPEKEDNEYIKQWKKEELEYDMKFFKEYCEKYSELYTKYWDAYEAMQHNKSSDDEASLKVIYQDAKDKCNLYKQMHSYYADVFDRVRWFTMERRGDLELAYKEAEQLFIKAINQHFKVLQAKVEAKIGEIVKIFPYNHSGGDYHFEGTTGDCDVEVIMAGGYNVQRLHTRWIIRNVKSSKAQ